MEIDDGRKTVDFSTTLTNSRASMIDMLYNSFDPQNPKFDLVIPEELFSELDTDVKINKISDEMQRQQDKFSKDKVSYIKSKMNEMTTVDVEYVDNLSVMIIFAEKEKIVERLTLSIKNDDNVKKILTKRSASGFDFNLSEKTFEPTQSDFKFGDY